MSGNALKIIAMISMVIDHVGFVFFPGEQIFRYVGRIAFPLYCFLLVEGFFHTGSVKKYLGRMGIFALISEVPFDLGLYHVLIQREYNNVFLTLFIGLLVMYFSDMDCRRTGSRGHGMFYCFAGMILAEMLHSDYGAMGVLVIYLFYLSWESRNCAENRTSRIWGTMLMMFSEAFLFMMEGPIERYACWALLLILFYSGKKTGRLWEKLRLERMNLFLKYFFYAFYPLHLLIIYLIFEIK